MAGHLALDQAEAQACGGSSPSSRANELEFNCSALGVIVGTKKVSAEDKKIDAEFKKWHKDNCPAKKYPVFGTNSTCVPHLPWGRFIENDKKYKRFYLKCCFDVFFEERDKKEKDGNLHRGPRKGPPPGKKLSM